MILFNGNISGPPSLVQTYLTLKEKLIEWERELKAGAGDKENAGRTALRVADEISKYIDSADGLKTLATQIDYIRATAGKWQ